MQAADDEIVQEIDEMLAWDSARMQQLRMMAEERRESGDLAASAVIFVAIGNAADRLQVDEHERLRAWQSISDVYFQGGIANPSAYESTAHLARRLGEQKVAGDQFYRLYKCCAAESVRWETRYQALIDARICYTNAGLSNESSDCNYLARDLMRANQPTKLGWFHDTVLFYLWGYGERPWRVAICALVVIAIFGFLYWGAGLKDAGCHWHERLGNAMYVSAITFTTLGYGDITPVTPYGKCLAGLEALLGIIFTGLFLVTFVKRYS